MRRSSAGCGRRQWLERQSGNAHGTILGLSRGCPFWIASALVRALRAVPCSRGWEDPPTAAARFVAARARTMTERVEENMAVEVCSNLQRGRDEVDGPPTRRRGDASERGFG